MIQNMIIQREITAANHQQNPMIEQTDIPRDYINTLSFDSGPAGFPEIGSSVTELLCGDFICPVSFNCFLEFTDTT